MIESSGPVGVRVGAVQAIRHARMHAAGHAKDLLEIVTAPGETAEDQVLELAALLQVELALAPEINLDHRGDMDSSWPPLEPSTSISYGTDGGEIQHVFRLLDSTVWSIMNDSTDNEIAPCKPISSLESLELNLSIVPG